VTIDHGDIFIRRLGVLSDPLQRVAIIGEVAEVLGGEGFADLLAVVLERASTRRAERDQLAVAAVMDFIDSERFDDHQRLELIVAARQGGHEALLRLLHAPEEGEPDAVERVPDYGKGRPLTLGERKSLARRPDRNLLERVLSDPHPDVIRNALRSSKITELDVIRMVSRRPNYAKALREVYQSPRWSRRYPVKVALVRNPHTPVEITLKLLPQLMKQDLQEILGDRRLSPPVIIACRRLLEGEVSSEDHVDDETKTVH
jgi:hypothetical protein